MTSALPTVLLLSVGGSLALLLTDSPLGHRLGWTAIALAGAPLWISPPLSYGAFAVGLFALLLAWLLPRAGEVSRFSLRDQTLQKIASIACSWAVLFFFVRVTRRFLPGSGAPYAYTGGFLSLSVIWVGWVVLLCKRRAADRATGFGLLGTGIGYLALYTSTTETVGGALAIALCALLGGAAFALGGLSLVRRFAPPPTSEDRP